MWLLKMLIFKYMNCIHTNIYTLIGFLLKVKIINIWLTLYYSEFSHCRKAEKFKGTTWFWSQNTLTSLYWKETVMSHWDDGVQATAKVQTGPRSTPCPAVCSFSPALPGAGNLPPTPPWGAVLAAEKLHKQAASQWLPDTIRMRENN